MSALPLLTPRRKPGRTLGSRFGRTSWMYAGLAIAAVLVLPLRAADEQPTVIESDSGEVVSTDVDSTFTFRNNVVVTGTNIKISCDLLVVVANRTGDIKATIGKQDKLRSLVATGHVRILQNDREATCDEARVMPGDDKAILSGHVLVRALDDTFRQTGERAELYRGERKAVIFGTPEHRPSTTLPPIKDLGFPSGLDKASGDKNTPPPGGQK
jgi:lipopolysaccharide export system protein LptA